MAKLPYMQFYPGDWLLDTQPLSTSARGIWIDILSFMWREEPRTGTLEYTVSGWCKRLRCTDAELRTALKEMELENVCKILTDECKDSVRITSRRIARDEKLRKANRLYVSKYRSKTPCKEVVTDVKGKCQGENQNHISEVRSQKLEKKEEKKTPLQATDEEWFADLKKNPAYEHINFPVENGKMDVWLSLPANRHRKKTRKFILNWLNKIEKPVQVPPAMNSPPSTCQERVQRGNFLKPCGDQAVTVMSGRPLCQQHKEHHEHRQHCAATA